MDLEHVVSIGYCVFEYGVIVSYACDSISVIDFYTYKRIKNAHRVPNQRRSSATGPQPQPQLTPWSQLTGSDSDRNVNVQV